MRVTFLTHYYPPEVGAPQARISALARGLRDRGVEVTVHTGFPNYPAGHVQPPYRNRAVQRETHDGFSVVRSAVMPTANRGFLPRLANHAVFAASALATAGHTGPQDVVVVETPPLFTAGAAVPYARLKRAPLVAHVSDLWPASAVQLGALTDARSVAAAERLEAWIYRHAAGITVPTRGMVRALEGHPDAAGKVRRMAPHIDLARFDGAAFGERTGPLRLVYAGTVGLAHGIETLIDAVALAGPDVAQLTIAGWGAEGDLARRRIDQRRAANVRMLGTVALDAVAGLYAQCDLGVVLLRDKPIFAEALPTKLFETMAAGRPVLLSARGEAADVLRAAEAGHVVAPEDPAALAQAIRDLHGADRSALAEMGARGRRHAEREASLEASVDRWLDLLVSVRGGRPAATASASRRRAAGRC